MSIKLNNCLVIGISSRALFDLREEDRVYEEQGLEAYRRYLEETGLGEKILMELGRIGFDLRRDSGRYAESQKQATRIRAHGCPPVPYTVTPYPSVSRRRRIRSMA